jgi:hypothetical protein
MRLPGHVVPGFAGGCVEQLRPDAEKRVGCGDLLVKRDGVHLEPVRGAVGGADHLRPAEHGRIPLHRVSHRGATHRVAAGSIGGQAAAEQGVADGVGICVAGD